MVAASLLLVIQPKINTQPVESITSHCPECNGGLARERTETICSRCGLVVAEDPLDRGPDWRRADDPSRSQRRVGAPLTSARHDRGLSTEIGFGNGRSRRLTGRTRRRFARLRRQHSRAQVRSKIERNRIYGFSEIRRLTAVLDLPESILERACVLFKTAQEEDLLRGRSLEGFAAAAVYANCRLSGLARARGEITEVARATGEELNNAYDALNRELGLPTGPIPPEEYIPRFASELDVPDDVERRAMELADRTRAEGVLNGRNPCGVAAGCLYAAAVERDHPLTQGAAADVADVAAVTVRGTYQALS